MFTAFLFVCPLVWNAMEAPMNNLYIGLLRLENRAAFFVQAKASQVTPRETAEERFHTLARGWLAYPVTPTHAHLPPKSGCRCQLMVGSQIHWLPHNRNHLANYLYNRSSAVDSFSFNWPQVGKPTWGYDYRTVLRRLHSSSDCAPPCENPPKSGFIR